MVLWLEMVPGAWLLELAVKQLLRQNLKILTNIQVAFSHDSVLAPFAKLARVVK